MKKSLLLKVLKILVLVLFVVGFFLPFVTGNHVALGDFSDSLWNIQDFAVRLGDTASSPVILVVVFVVVAALAGASLFYKEELSRYAFLAAHVVGLAVIGYVYYLIFIDVAPALQAAIDGGAFTMTLGLGVYLQLVLLAIGLFLEFGGKKVLKD
ncbi:MAG: hypothetical protein ABH890_06690 [Bacillota bacterium]